MKLKSLNSKNNNKFLINSLYRKNKVFTILMSLIIFLIILGLIIWLYFLYTENDYQFKGVFKEGLIQQPININPLTPQNDTDKSLSQLIHSGLLKQNKNLEFEPDLAQSLPITVKEADYLKICLKKDISWHNNKKLSIDDVIFTYNKAKKLDDLNPKLSFVRLLDITKLDNNCLKIKSNLSRNQLYSLLTVGIIPKHIWQEIDLSEQETDFSIKPVGTGMFQFDSLGRNKNSEIVFYNLKHNKKYYNKKPNIKNIEFSFYKNLENSHQALKNKEINAFSPHINPIFSLPEHVQNHKFNWNFYSGLFFNLKNELFNNQEIREALSLLTPKKKILKENLNYNGLIINGPVLPSSFFYYPDIEKTNFNIKEAIEILKRNDWDKNNNGFWEKDDQIIEFTIKTIDQPVMVEIARSVQEAWQSIGLKVKLITMPTQRIKTIISEKDFEVVLYGVLTNYNAGLFSLWHSSDSLNSTLNITNLNNRKINELLENAVIVTNLNEKKEYYKNFQKLISEIKPAIFLYNFNYNYLVDKNIKGIGVKAINQPGDRFINIENWYNEVKRVWR